MNPDETPHAIGYCGIADRAEAAMGEWNESSADFYRDLERQQRALAADATCTATRDIHLEFAAKYQKLAEQVEAGMNQEAGSRAAS